MKWDQNKYQFLPAAVIKVNTMLDNRYTAERNALSANELLPRNPIAYLPKVTQYPLQRIFSASSNPATRFI